MGTDSDTMYFRPRPSDDTSLLSRLERRLPPLLSVVAGMVDLIGFSATPGCDRADCVHHSDGTYGQTRRNCQGGVISGVG
jgi:hypothetical protein